MPNRVYTEGDRRRIKAKAAEARSAGVSINGCAEYSGIAKQTLLVWLQEDAVFFNKFHGGFKAAQIEVLNRLKKEQPKEWLIRTSRDYPSVDRLEVALDDGAPAEATVVELDFSG